MIDAHQSNARAQTSTAGSGARADYILVELGDGATAPGERLAAIGPIADLVRGVAGEAELLAMNAATELTRLGEDAPGLRVLAGQLRDLASHARRVAIDAEARIAAAVR